MTNMVFTADDRTRLFRRQRTQQAIQLAMQGQWQEAAAVNRAIIAVFPNDVDAYNRLGKALTELGQYSEAREAYAKTLELDSLNSIAQKNLTRLATLDEGAAVQAEGGQKLSPQMFISEMGKTGITVLTRAAAKAAARMTAGDQVFLRRQNNTLVVESGQGEYLGEIEPKLGMRLIKLMEGGNQYAAAIATLNQDDVRVIIKETFQDPSQAGKLSFPPTAGDAFRAYTKEGLLRRDVEEEDDSFEEGDDAEDWDSRRKSPEVDVTLYEFAAGGEEEEEE
ncbi:MAG: tetratricopeptide repeat protein [Dehalococcoidia bacterium]|nr:MAG: tetratricopeptide repeat protein [Dehalococcoidia bacterium]